MVIRIKEKTGWIIATISFLILGVVFFVVGLSTISGLKKAEDSADVETSSYKEGMWIKGKTDLVWGCYCREYEEKSGTKKDRFRWYLVRIDSADEAECFIGVKVPESEFENYQKMLEDEQDYELTLQGKLVMATGSILQYKQDMMKEIDKKELSKYEIEYVCPDYYIELKDTKTGRLFLWLGIGVFACGAAFFVYLLILYLRSAKASPYDELVEQRVAEYSANRIPTGNSSAPRYTPTRPVKPWQPTKGDIHSDTDSDINSEDTLQKSGIGASTGFYLHGEQDELSQLLAEEDQKIANYNFKTGLTGSDRVEEDK